MAHPLNVQACLDWYREHMPGQEVHVEHLLARSGNTTGDVEHGKHIFHADDREARERIAAEGIIAIMLQGFEAGRQFQKDNPDLEPGIGYLPRDLVPQLSPSKNCPNCHEPIGTKDCKSIRNQRYQCGRCGYIWDVVQRTP